MKKCILFIFGFVSFTFLSQLNAQTTSILLGLHFTTGNAGIYNSLKTGTGTITDIAPLAGVEACAQGETTFDRIHHRQFMSTNIDMITIVDAENGDIIDQIPNTVHMHSYEYDMNTGKLIGIYWNGTVEKLVSLNLTTKTFTDLGTLNGVQYSAQGESALDASGRRYFIRTSFSRIVVISLLSNSIIDYIDNPLGFNSIEYDPYANRLIGWYTYVASIILTSVNLSTKVFTDIGTIAGIDWAAQGECSYDAINKRYFIQTHNAILTINAQNGEIIESYSSSVLMHLIEFYKTVDYDPQLSTIQKYNCTIYPNPFNNASTIQLNTSLTDAELTIYDINGRGIKTIAHLSGDALTIDRNGLPKGIYYFKINQDNKAILRDKLFVTD